MRALPFALPLPLAAGWPLIVNRSSGSRLGMLRRRRRLASVEQQIHQRIDHRSHTGHDREPEVNLVGVVVEFGDGAEEERQKCDDDQRQLNEGF